MIRRMLSLLFLSGALAWLSGEESFDRIVLKDMTVIKASLVKEEGDSLAYFEADDPEFVKHKVARDQVFKWVKAADKASPAPAPKAAVPAPPPVPAPVPPPPPLAPVLPPPAPAALAPAIAMPKDTFPDNIPVADYQAISARLDSIERSKLKPAPAPIVPAAPPVAPEKINAAVFGLTGKGLGKSSAGVNATAQMRAELSNTGVFRIMERAEMERILNEKKFSIKGACDDPACLAGMGRALGVDRMLSGAVTHDGRIWTFSLSMIDAGTGAVLHTVTENYEGWIKKDVVPEVTARLARQMADRAIGRQAAAVNPETGVITATAAPAVAEYDTNDAVPEGLAQVRLDPPTGTEGIKIVPRSGMVALNINPSFTSLGLGLRTWSAGGVGFAAGGAVMWGSASGFSVKAQPMLALNARSKSRVRWYLFPLIGYNWQTITTPSMFGIPSTEQKITYMYYVFGLGAEWRVGINRNHGLAAEIGYQGGKGTYEIEPFTYMGTTIDPGGEKTYNPPSFYLMFSYAYYF